MRRQPHARRLEREPAASGRLTTSLSAQPNTVEETGIGFGQLLDLCIKTIYYGGRPSPARSASRMALPFNVIETLLAFLKREKFIEVVGSSGLGEQQYQYALTDKGNEKAVEALERNQYVGPTPVPFEEYVEVVMRAVDPPASASTPTSSTAPSATSSSADTTRNLVGPAVNSGRSLLLYGDPGNGKSSIAKGIGRMLQGHILIPHAIDVSGQTIRVFDPRVHQDVDGAMTTRSARSAP